jgi:hypothetical protein
MVENWNIDFFGGFPVSIIPVFQHSNREGNELACPLQACGVMPIADCIFVGFRIRIAQESFDLGKMS